MTISDQGVANCGLRIVNRGLWLTSCKSPQPATCMIWKDRLLRAATVKERAGTRTFALASGYLRRSTELVHSLSNISSAPGCGVTWRGDLVPLPHGRGSFVAPPMRDSLVCSSGECSSGVRELVIGSLGFVSSFGLRHFSFSIYHLAFCILPGSTNTKLF